MADIEAFRRHMKPSVEVKLKYRDANGNEGEDTFKLKPLPWKHMDEFWKLANGLQKIMPEEDKKLSEEEEAKMVLKAMNEDMINTFKAVSFETLRHSYPLEKYPELTDEELQKFCRDNMFDLLNPIVEVNTPKVVDVPKKKEDVNKG